MKKPRGNTLLMAGHQLIARWGGGELASTGQKKGGSSAPPRSASADTSSLPLRPWPLTQSRPRASESHRGQCGPGRPPPPPQPTLSVPCPRPSSSRGRGPRPLPRGPVSAAQLPGTLTSLGSPTPTRGPRPCPHAYPQKPQGQRGGRLGALLRSLPASPMVLGGGGARRRRRWRRLGLGPARRKRRRRRRRRGARAGGEGEGAGAQAGASPRLGTGIPGRSAGGGQHHSA